MEQERRTGVIPAEAVEAAHEQLNAMGAYVTPKYLRAALEAAAPYMLSDEREQTRLAHLDAMVNRDTAARLEQAIAGVLELAAPMRHMVSASEIRVAISNALGVEE